MHEDAEDYLPRPQTDVSIPDSLLAPGISDHIPQVKPTVANAQIPSVIPSVEPNIEVDVNVQSEKVNVPSGNVKVSPAKPKPCNKSSTQSRHHGVTITRSGRKSVPPSRLIYE